MARAVRGALLLVAGAIVASLATGAAGAQARSQPPLPRATADRPAKVAGFRAAAVRVDITPQTPQWLLGYQARQSTGVHDNIYHRVVAHRCRRHAVLPDLERPLSLLAVLVRQRDARAIESELGISPKQVMWSVTHTHAAPEIGPPDMYKALLGRSDHEWDRDYTSRTTRALVDAVRSARGTSSSRRASRSGPGIAMANINRRAKDVDGRVSLGLNPDGPVDRQINLIRLDRPDGSLIALVANYAMHGTVMSGDNLSISGDAPGTVAAYLEQKLGGTVLYINGAAGNIAPIYSVYPTPESGHLSQFRVLLGDRILAAVAAMGPGTSDVTMRHEEKIIETPRRAGLAWPDELGRVRRFRRPPAGPASGPVPAGSTTPSSGPPRSRCSARSRWTSGADRLFRRRCTSDTPTGGSDICPPRRGSKREATSRRRRRSQRRWKGIQGWVTSFIQGFRR